MLFACITSILSVKILSSDNLVQLICHYGNVTLYDSYCTVLKKSLIFAYKNYVDKALAFRHY